MMKKTLLLLPQLLCFLYADLHTSISVITPEITQRIVGRSWHKGCPVPLHELRYLRIRYLGFDSRTHHGEMIVHQDVADEVVKIFDQLYVQGYPIRQMRLISDFGGSDWQSIEADNTSAFNCRKATGSKKWSKHAYGKAIDINPIENPYISHRGHISHKASQPYRKRKDQRRSSPQKQAVILPHDRIVHLFKMYGWKWGGDWHSVKDYQHFSK